LEFGGIGGIIGHTGELGSVMKIKAVLEAFLAAVISLTLSYRLLIVPATLAGVAIRRKMPDAWFSGLITWYALFVVVGVSMVIAGVACRIVYKHAVRSTPRA
jgi:hypothetical protein